MAQKHADVLKKAKAAGWSISKTNGGHLKLEHPESSQKVITSLTPSDHRAGLNLKAHLKRSLPPTPSEKTKSKAATSKNKPKPREPSSNFSMQHRAFPREEVPVIDATEPWWTSLPQGTVRRAWSLALLRLRVEGKDWGVIRAIKDRVRTDNAFCADMVQSWLDTPASKAKELKIILHQGFKAEPKARTYQPSSAPGPGKAPPPSVVLEPPAAGPATFAMLAMERLRANMAEAKVIRLEELLLEAKLLAQAPPPPPPPPAPSKKKALMEERAKRLGAEASRDAAVAALVEERKLRQALEEKLRAPSSKPGKAPAPLPAPPVAQCLEGEDGLPDRLAIRRQSLHLTQAELGRRIGVSGPSLSHWENGLRRPKPARMNDLARALGCPVAWLASGQA